MNKKNKTILSAAVIVLGVILDQITKMIAVNGLKDAGYVSLLGDILGFELVKNPGAFLGMFSDNRLMFMIPSMIMIGVLFVWIYLHDSPHPLFVVSLSLLVSGGIGNMIDRIRLEYVIDFISFKFINFPNFNIADSFITIGCVLLVICVFIPGTDIFDVTFSAKKAKQKTKVPSNPENKDE